MPAKRVADRRRTDENQGQGFIKIRCLLGFEPASERRRPFYSNHVRSGRAADCQFDSALIITSAAAGNCADLHNDEEVINIC